MCVCVCVCVCILRACVLLSKNSSEIILEIFIFFPISLSVHPKSYNVPHWSLCAHFERSTNYFE